MVEQRAEHCGGPDARLDFTTGNYGITTTSFIEYLYVVDPTPVGLALAKIDQWPAESSTHAGAGTLDEQRSPFV